MPRLHLAFLALSVTAALATAHALRPPPAGAACCYFAAKDKDVLQPAQKVFITWDPVAGVETFAVQPAFVGSAADFGMVIPTPAKPTIDEMPRDLFKHLAVFTILKRREQPESSILPQMGFGGGGFGGFAGGGLGGGGLGGFGGGFGGGGLNLGGLAGMRPPPPVRVVESGVVGSLDYKTLEADRADALFAWLKDHKYHYAGDEATLDFYVKKKWFFTVMKVDAAQMRRRGDGTFAGDITPTRFRFASETLIYPLKITQISVKESTEALFYVQAPHKVDLPGAMTYQYQWLPMLVNAHGNYAKGTFGADELPGKGDAWLKASAKLAPELLQRGADLGFGFVNNQRPRPNQEGRTPTTLEWAKKLSERDIKTLKGEVPFGETVPDVDEGFTANDLRDPQKKALAARVIQKRLADAKKERPGGFLVREAPKADVQGLRQLVGHLKEGQFLTKFRKTFTRGEMNDDLTLVPARLGDNDDISEYEEILPTSPP